MKTQRSGALAFPILLGAIGGVEAARAVRQDQRQHGAAASLLSAGNGTLRGLAAAAAAAAVPPPIDYNPETHIYWVDETRLPITVEALVAVTWIAMVAGFPMLGLGADGGSVTRSRLAESAVMWVVLLGGTYLFTNVLLFQSVHFETVRSLSLVECVYFMCQVITTVGYGDITPAKPRGQVFVALYVVFCLLVLARIFEEVVSLVSRCTDRLGERFAAWLKQFGSSQVAQEAEGPSVGQWLGQGRPQLPWLHLQRSCVIYFLCCLVGVLFFVLHPGEGKTWLQGIYMSVITLSTVGFGAVTPVTELGKAFAAFWMLFGSTALVGLIGSFTTFMLALRHLECFDPAEALEHDRRVLEKLPERFGGAEFLKFGLLHAGAARPEDLERIEKAFRSLQPSADGTVSKEQARRFFGQ